MQRTRHDAEGRLTMHTHRSRTPHSMALAALALATIAAPPLEAQRDQGRSRIDTTFAFGQRGTLDISVVSGTIIIRSSGRDEARVNATSEEGIIRLETSPGRIAIGVRSNRGHMGDSKFEIAVPAGTRVLAHTTSGDISIRNVKGEVEARSTSGDIKIEDAERVTFEAISGSVEATRVTGTLTGTSVSGDLTLEGGVGDIDVESVSGEISLSKARAKTVRAKTVSGDVTFDGTVDQAGRYTFGTHSGTLKLSLPDNTAATLSIDTFNGDVESDFPMVLRPGERRGRHMEFTIGSGGARVSAETFSGDIEIRKASKQR
ncbi:MAG: DUF4097 family beta strand repeat-containing protein [Gemmatimonadaceae bacterium]